MVEASHDAWMQIVQRTTGTAVLEILDTGVF
jgi:hypothetical protein